MKKKIILLFTVLLFSFSLVLGATYTVEQNRRPTIVVSYDEDVSIVNTSLVREGFDKYELLEIFRENKTEYDPTSIPQILTKYYFHFKPIKNLGNGDYIFTIYAADKVDNIREKTESFKVDIQFTKILLKNPEFGVSTSPIFDLILSSSANLEGCVYFNGESSSYIFDKLKNTPSLNFVTSADQITHTISNFNLGIKEDEIKRISVICKEPTNFTNEQSPKVFDLLWDNSKPLLNVYADPKKAIDNINVNIVAESIPFSNNPDKSDKKDLINCRFSKDETKDYNSMEYHFYNNDTNYNDKNIVSLSEIETQYTPKIEFLNSEATYYTFYVQCKNRAGLLSDKSKVDFIVDLSAGGIITDAGPEGYIKSTTVNLYAKTNRLSQCSYKKKLGDTPHLFPTSIGLNDSKSHQTNLSNLAEGKYDYIIECFNFKPFGDLVSEEISFTIDISKPTETLINLKPVCYGKEIIANLSSKDSSGISNFEYQITEGMNTIIALSNITASNNQKELKVSAKNLEVGKEYSIELFAYDKAGNKGDLVTSKFKVLNNTENECKEKNPPVVTIIQNKVDSGIEIKIICVDESECGEIQYTYLASSTDSCLFTYESLYSVPFIVSSNGKICYKATDLIGNEAIGEKNITVGEKQISCGKDGSIQDEKCKTLDLDNDTFTPNQGDCDDMDPFINPNAEEVCDEKDNNCDGKIDNSKSCIPDTDNDGMNDEWEKNYSSCGLNFNDPKDKYLDFDKDGLTNIEEYNLGTDPCNPDTDGDGIFDGGERTSGTDPNDKTSVPIDSDKDGIDDEWEKNYFNTTDYNDGTKDSDNDGLTDYQEYLWNTNPLNPDTDGDGIFDGEEVNKYHTNPREKDTDGDGYNDKVEIDAETDPLDPNSYPRKDTITPIEDETKSASVSFVALILLILGLLSNLGGGGYLAYKKYYKNKNSSLYSNQPGYNSFNQPNTGLNNNGIGKPVISGSNPRIDILKMQAMKAAQERIALQQAIVKKRRSEKNDKKSSIMSSFDDSNEKKKEELKILDKKEVKLSESLISRRIAEKQKKVNIDNISNKSLDQAEQNKLKQANDLMKELALKNNNKDDKLDKLIKHDSVFDKLDKFSNGKNKDKLNSIIENDDVIFKKLEKYGKNENSDNVKNKLEELNHKNLDKDKFSKIISKKDSMSIDDFSKKMKKEDSIDNILNKAKVNKLKLKKK